MNMKINIKTLFFTLFLVTSLLFISTASVKAGSANNLLPPWFVEATRPIQEAITQLVVKTDNHEQRIAELEAKVTELQKEIDAIKPVWVDLGNPGTLQVTGGGDGGNGVIPTPTP